MSPSAGPRDRTVAGRGDGQPARTSSTGVVAALAQRPQERVSPDNSRTELGPGGVPTNSNRDACAGVRPSHVAPSLPASPGGGPADGVDWLPNCSLVPEDRVSSTQTRRAPDAAAPAAGEVAEVTASQNAVVPARPE